MLSDEVIKYFNKYVSEENLRKKKKKCIYSRQPVFSGQYLKTTGHTSENYELLLAIFLEVRTS